MTHSRAVRGKGVQGGHVLAHEVRGNPSPHPHPQHGLVPRQFPISELSLKFFRQETIAICYGKFPPTEGRETAIRDVGGNPVGCGTAGTPSGALPYVVGGLKLTPSSDRREALPMDRSASPTLVVLPSR